jgi:RNA-directed DNA polymerase
MKKFKAEIKRITRRTRGVSTSVIYCELSDYLRGAMNYYLIGVTYRVVRELDQWIRRRMRLYYWKQWGRPRARRHNLIKLGAPLDKVKLASRSRKGHWRLTNIEIVRNAMNNA